jgi:hypothetical protein
MFARAARSVLVAFGALAVGQQDARGAAAPRFYLRYSAPASCPEQSEWLRRLRAHSPHAEMAVASEAAPSLSVDLTEVPGGVQAVLSATDLDGDVTNRALVGPTCREAVEASAWILAVWLDPAAAASPAEPPPAEATLNATTPVAAATEQRPLITVPGDSLPPRASRSATSNAVTRWGVGAELGTFFTALPALPFGAGGFLEAAWPRSGVLRPIVHVGGYATLAGTSDTARGDVRMRLASARVLGCALEWPVASPVTLHACASFELGSISGRGENTFKPGEATAIWRALGASARGKLAVARLMSVDAEAGLVFPLLRDRFVFAPNPVLSGYAIPALGGTLSLGFTVHFSAH